MFLILFGKIFIIAKRKVYSKFEQGVHEMEALNLLISISITFPGYAFIPTIPSPHIICDGAQL